MNDKLQWCRCGCCILSSLAEPSVIYDCCSGCAFHAVFALSSLSARVSEACARLVDADRREEERPGRYFQHPGSFQHSQGRTSAIIPLVCTAVEPVCTSLTIYRVCSGACCITQYTFFLYPLLCRMAPPTELRLSSPCRVPEPAVTDRHWRPLRAALLCPR